MIPTHCTCNADDETMCAYCMRESALAAGIPASVFDGHTKLSDHFSPEYIKSRCAGHRQPDMDICSECGEHADFDENGSNCCGAKPYDTDSDWDMER